MSHPARIEQLVRRAGATRYVYDWRPGQALIGFELSGRHIRLNVDLPSPDDAQFTRTPSRGEYRAQSTAQKLYEDAVARIWAELADVIEAKLRFVAAGHSTVEQEFLAWMDDARQISTLPPQRDGDADSLLRALIAAAQDVLQRRQVVVQSDHPDQQSRKAA